MGNEKSVVGLINLPLAKPDDSRAACGDSGNAVPPTRGRAPCKLALYGFLAALLATAQFAMADYLGTKTIRMFVDPADLPVIQNGLDTGDQIRLVGEAMPGATDGTLASGTVNVGSTITDQATLSGGAAPTGSITFVAYGPNDATCATAVFTSNAITVNGNGTYTSAPGFTTTAAGTYGWRAFYSGDANNGAVSGLCGAANESATITPLTPSLNKAFGPPSFQMGGFTTLTFTVTNPAGNPALANVGFTDNLPSGLQIANPNGVGASTCANAAAVTTAVAGQTGITVANLQVPAGAASCTVTVNVTNKAGQVNPSCAGDPAAFTNGQSNVSVTNVNNGVVNSCVVVNTFTFSITKSPSAGIVVPGQALSFTIAVTNNGPSAADGTIITDPAIPFYTASDPVVCVGTNGGASCPAPLTVAAMQGAGMTVATYPAGATITLRIDGTSSLVSGRLVNTVTVSPPAGIPGVASASAAAAVSAQVGVIPTLSLNALITLMLLVGLGPTWYLRRLIALMLLVGLGPTWYLRRTKR